MQSKSFHDYVVFDVFGALEGITSRAMFGGWGLYKKGKIFGIIVGEELYCKYNEKSSSIFKEYDSHPFVYGRKDGKEISMSYWLVPEELMENRERLYELVNNLTYGK